VADFSSSGIADLPPTTAESLQRGDPRVLGWIKEAREDGDRIVMADPSYEQIEKSLRYVVGEQLAPERSKLRYLPQVVINESRKAMQAHVSALTDLKPLFGWRTINAQYQQQADLLNQYAVAEWVTTFADLELGDCIKIGLAAGTGDLVVDWDPHAPLGGAHSFSARDPRDTLPIRPAHARSIQLWEGVILREEHTVNALRSMYPTKANYFRPSPDNALSRVMGRFRSRLSQILTPADPLDALGAQGVHTRKARSGSVALYRTYLHDHTRNLTSRPITVGQPGSNWAYVVKPNDPIYPRGRLIVSTDDLVLFDGPNTYWHGMFPVCRLRLWSVPWQFLGVPLFNDLLPVQDAINDTVNDLRLGIAQWLEPDVEYNRNSVSENSMRIMDTRKPGKKVKVNPAFGEPWKKLDGPNPQVLTLAAELWDKLTTKHNDLSGTANLAALLQLRQLPSADTIERYYEALTPEIRQEARQVEAFMRDLAQMTKVNYYQFLSQAKRVMILGEVGQTLQDFDYDPGTMVPALNPGDPGYTPELDKNLTTVDERAQWMQGQFVFVVAPNSILAMNSADRKMMLLQLSRQGYCDMWTLLEALEIPNVGTPPAIPLPPLGPISPQLQQQILMHVMQSVQQGQIPPPPYQDPQTGKTYTMDPSGQIMELRIPTDITSRLMAQNMLQIGMTQNAAGRKASGQEPPKNEQKSDGQGGTRQTVTESKH
jgi:hypothetical protein